MPWLSQLARTTIVVLTDRDLLPDEAAQDRDELARAGVAQPGRVDVQLARRDVRQPVAGQHRGRRLARAAGRRLPAAQRGHHLAPRRSSSPGARSPRPSTPAPRRRRATSSSSARSGTSCVRPSPRSWATPRCCSTTRAQAPDGLVAAAMLRDGPVIVRAMRAAARHRRQPARRRPRPLQRRRAPGRRGRRRGGRRRPLAPHARAGRRRGDARRRRPRPDRVGARVGRTPGADQPPRQRHHPPPPRRRLGPPLGRAPPRARAASRWCGSSCATTAPAWSADQLAHAFEPFVRFAPRGTKGTGLGLSISRTIAERDGGAVRGESTPGTGSTFWLELPAPPRGGRPGHLSRFRPHRRAHVFSSPLGQVAQLVRAIA